MVQPVRHIDKAADRGSEGHIWAASVHPTYIRLLGSSTARACVVFHVCDGRARRSQDGGDPRLQSQYESWYLWIVTWKHENERYTQRNGVVDQDDSQCSLGPTNTEKIAEKRQKFRGERNRVMSSNNDSRDLQW